MPKSIAPLTTFRSALPKPGQILQAVGWRGDVPGSHARRREVMAHEGATGQRPGVAPVLWCLPGRVFANCAGGTGQGQAATGGGDRSGPTKAHRQAAQENRRGQHVQADRPRVARPQGFRLRACYLLFERQPTPSWHVHLLHAELAPTTLKSTTTELGRFLLWCQAQGKRFADIRVENLLAYKAFLCDPQPAEKWISSTRWPRRDPRWRPFAGSLSEPSLAIDFICAAIDALPGTTSAANKARTVFYLLPI